MEFHHDLLNEPQESAKSRFYEEFNAFSKDGYEICLLIDENICFAMQADELYSTNQFQTRMTTNCPSKARGGKNASAQLINIRVEPSLYKIR